MLPARRMQSCPYSSTRKFSVTPNDNCTARLLRQGGEGDSHIAWGATERDVPSRERRSLVPYTVHVFVEEAHHVLRNLWETGVEWLRANLREHVPHVLDQDKLSLVTRSLEVSIESRSIAT